MMDSRVFLWGKNMIGQNFLKLSLVALVLFLSGCASWFFPDFEEEKDVVIDDGGNVEMREVKNNGILVADKENALYEGDDENITDEQKEAETVVAAKVEPVKNEALPDEGNVKPVDNVRIVEAKSTDEVVQRPSMRYLAGVIYFSNGGAGIDGEERAKLKKIAKKAKDNNALVEVYGFASSRTRNTDPVTHKLANFNISAKRAENTAAVLRSLGVKADNIEVQALSDSMPMYKEVMPEGERLNRRAEVYLTY